MPVGKETVDAVNKQSLKNMVAMALVVIITFASALFLFLLCSCFLVLKRANILSCKNCTLNSEKIKWCHQTSDKNVEGHMEKNEVTDSRIKACEGNDSDEEEVCDKKRCRFRFSDHIIRDYAEKVIPVSGEENTNKDLSVKKEVLSIIEQQEVSGVGGPGKSAIESNETCKALAEIIEEEEPSEVGTSVESLKEIKETSEIVVAVIEREESKTGALVQITEREASGARASDEML